MAPIQPSHPLSTQLPHLTEQDAHELLLHQAERLIQQKKTDLETHVCMKFESFIQSCIKISQKI